MLSKTFLVLRKQLGFLPEMELGHIFDPATRESSDQQTQLTLFYNELQTSTYVWRSILRPKNF